MQDTADTLVLLGTGGTIAGRLDSTAAVSGRYQAGAIGVDQLLDAATASRLAPGLRVEVEQVAQIDSKDMDPATWVKIVQRVRAHLQRVDVRAVIVTHGTDTMEETAYLLHRVAGADGKPVVLVGAMRPADSADADGPANLGDAMAVAAHPDARGVVLVMAGQVHAATLARKVATTALDAFRSIGPGTLGRIRSAGGVDWYRPCPASARPAPRLLDRLLAGPWPRVELVVSHGGASEALVDALVASGVAGLVIAGTGNGTVHQAIESAVGRARAAGVSVRRCTRIWSDAISDPECAADPEAQNLTPAQARLALVLDLLSGPDAVR